MHGPGGHEGELERGELCNIYSAVAVGRKARSKKHNRLSVPCLLLESGVFEWRDLISRIPLAFIIKYGKFAAILPQIWADERYLWLLQKCESCKLFLMRMLIIPLLFTTGMFILLIYLKLK